MSFYKRAQSDKRILVWEEKYLAWMDKWAKSYIQKT